jgi:hypothetical protein
MNSTHLKILYEIEYKFFKNAILSLGIEKNFDLNL